MKFQKKIISVWNSMKIARAYVATKAEVARMVEVTGLRAENVKCGEIASQHISAAWTMRKGELLGVFDLTAFAPLTGNPAEKRAAIVAAVEKIQAQGADVCEVETGAIAGKGAAMLDRALRKLYAESRGNTPEKMREIATRKRETSYDDARAIWGNRTKYPLEGQALMNMKGWNRSAAFRAFGKRAQCELDLIAERKAKRRKAKR